MANGFTAVGLNYFSHHLNDNARTHLRTIPNPETETLNHLNPTSPECKIQQNQHGSCADVRTANYVTLLLICSAGPSLNKGPVEPMNSRLTQFRLRGLNHLGQTTRRYTLEFQDPFPLQDPDPVPGCSAWAQTNTPRIIQPKALCSRGVFWHAYGAWRSSEGTIYLSHKLYTGRMSYGADTEPQQRRSNTRTRSGTVSDPRFMEISTIASSDRERFRFLQYSIVEATKISHVLPLWHLL